MFCVALSGAQSATRLYVARIMAEYLRRLVDTELDELMLELPAIVLEGPKGVGKTATAERRARTIVRLDDPAHRAIAEADPGWPDTIGVLPSLAMTMDGGMLKIISWNNNQKKDAWRHLLSTDADIALVQEALRPPRTSCRASPLMRPRGDREPGAESLP